MAITRGDNKLLTKGVVERKLPLPTSVVRMNEGYIDTQVTTEYNYFQRNLHCGALSCFIFSGRDSKKDLQSSYSLLVVIN